MVRAVQGRRRRCSAAAQQRLQRDGSGTVLGVTYDDSTPDSLEFVEKYGVRYPNVRDVGTQARRATTARRACRRRSSSIARGRIVDYYRGPIDEERLDRALDKALG